MILLQYDRLHATGYLSMESDNLDSSPLNVSEIHSRLSPTDMKGIHVIFYKFEQLLTIYSNFYKDLSGFAQYGKKYQHVTSCFRGVSCQGQDEFLISVHGNRPISSQSEHLIMSLLYAVAKLVYNIR